jgi:hypothetical protein
LISQSRGLGDVYKRQKMNNRFLVAIFFQMTLLA